MSTIPIGFRFAPSDSEILTYLIRTLRVGTDDFIVRANVFDSEPPWALFERYTSTSCMNAGVAKPAYFYSVVNKKGKIGLKNFNSKVGEFGTWKGDNKGTDIVDPVNKRVLLGTKRKFSFRTAYESSCKWLMTEYSLAGENKSRYPCGSDHKDYVLCKIKRKIDTRKRQEEAYRSASTAIDHLNLQQFMVNIVNPENNGTYVAESTQQQQHPEEQVYLVNFDSEKNGEIMEDSAEFDGFLEDFLNDDDTP